MTTLTTAPYRARTLAIFIPVALLAASSSAILPAVLALALAYGASPAQAGLVTTMAGVGQMVVSLPAGQLISRFGVRVSLPASAALTLGGLLVVLLPTTVLGLGVGVFLVGAGNSAHTLCRIAAVAADIPRADRPQAFAHLSIAIRGGAVAGPLLGALAFALTRDIVSPVVVAMVFAAAAVVIHLSARLPGSGPTPTVSRVTVRQTISRNRVPLRRVSVIALAVAGLRHTKIVLIPLVALAQGLDVGQVSVLLAAAAVVGMAAMYLGARVSRAHGWFMTGVASNTGIALGLAALIFAHGPVALIAAVALIEVAMGIGAGFMSTVFSEEAPDHNPTPLMGVFNLVTEAASVAVPAAVMGVVAVAALPVGVAVGAVFGAAGTVWLWRWGRTPASRTHTVHEQ